MAEPSKEDELAGTEQPFVAHLVELRDRLIKAFIAVAVAGAVLALCPGPAALYDILAAPLTATLPKGATLIATSVISPFLVPLKILLMTAFLIALPVVLYQVWAFVAPVILGGGTTGGPAPLPDVPRLAVDHVSFPGGDVLIRGMIGNRLVTSPACRGSRSASG